MIINLIDPKPLNSNLRAHLYRLNIHYNAMSTSCLA